MVRKNWRGEGREEEVETATDLFVHQEIARFPFHALILTFCRNDLPWLRHEKSFIHLADDVDNIFSQHLFPHPRQHARHKLRCIL